MVGCNGYSTTHDMVAVVVLDSHISNKDSEFMPYRWMSPAVPSRDHSLKPIRAVAVKYLAALSIARWSRGT